MKRILIVCLLGMGLLLPSTTITANGFITKRIVDVTIEGDVLLASSDSNTGTITKIEVYNSQSQLVLYKTCSDYNCSLNIRELPSGSYTALIITTLTSYSEGFVRV